MRQTCNAIPLALAALVACSPKTLDPVLGTGEEAPADVEIDRGVNRIEVQTQTGDIDIILSADEGTYVNQITGAEGDDIEWVLDLGVLTLWATCPNGLAGCASGFAIEAPADVEYVVETIDGLVAFERTTGSATITTETSEIRGRSLGAMDFTADTLEAPHDLQFADEPLSVVLSSISGAIDVELPQGDYDIEISTNGATDTQNVEIDATGPPVHITSTSGDVTIVGI